MQNASLAWKAVIAACCLINAFAFGALAGAHAERTYLRNEKKAELRQNSLPMAGRRVMSDCERLVRALGAAGGLSCGD